MTLPLIYTLQKADNDVKRKIIYIVKNQNTNKKKVNEVIDYVKAYGGIQYAHERMLMYKKEALDILRSYPDTPQRQAMEELVNYVIDRKY